MNKNHTKNFENKKIHLKKKLNNKRWSMIGKKGQWIKGIKKMSHQFRILKMDRKLPE